MSFDIDSFSNTTCYLFIYYYLIPVGSYWETASVLLAEMANAFRKEGVLTCFVNNIVKMSI